MISHRYLKVDIWFLRSALAWVLLMLAFFMIPLSIILFWLRFTIFDTNQFVKTLGPISKNPYIIESLSNSLSENFFQSVNVQGKIREALPDKAKFLAPALTIELKNFVAKEGQVILTSDAFNNLWEKVLRTVHPEIIGIMTGQGNVSVNKQGEVVLDFSDSVSKLKDNLNSKGITLFSNLKIKPQISIFKSEKLAYFQNVLSSISFFGIAFPITTVLLIAGAMISSLKRLQFLFWVGIGILASSIILFFLLQAGEGYFAKTAVEINAKAAGALYQILTESLKKWLIGVMILGLIIALGSKYLPKIDIVKKYLTK